MAVIEQGWPLVRYVELSLPETECSDLVIWPSFSLDSISLCWSDPIVGIVRKRPHCADRADSGGISWASCLLSVHRLSCSDDPRPKTGQHPVPKIG